MEHANIWKPRRDSCHVLRWTNGCFCDNLPGEMFLSTQCLPQIVSGWFGSLPGKQHIQWPHPRKVFVGITLFHGWFILVSWSVFFNILHPTSAVIKPWRDWHQFGTFPSDRLWNESAGEYSDVLMVVIQNSCSVLIEILVPWLMVTTCGNQSPTLAWTAFAVTGAFGSCNKRMQGTWSVVGTSAS